MFQRYDSIFNLIIRKQKQQFNQKTNKFMTFLREFFMQFDEKLGTSIQTYQY